MTQTMSSQDASAIIDGALLNANSPDQAITELGTDENPAVPGPLPTDQPVVDEENLTPEQKKARADEEKIRKAQQDMLGKEQAKALEEEKRKQVEREKTLLGLGEKLLNQGKSSASGLGVKIGNLPTPGNISVPLVLLAIFFFILIAYAGHTRFQWGWLVLTGNAYVTGSDQSGNGTGGGPPDTAQETLVGVVPAIPTPAISPNGVYGSPY